MLPWLLWLLLLVAKKKKLPLLPPLPLPPLLPPLTLPSPLTLLLPLLPPLTRSNQHATLEYKKAQPFGWAFSLPVRNTLASPQECQPGKALLQLFQQQAQNLAGGIGSINTALAGHDLNLG